MVMSAQMSIAPTSTSYSVSLDQNGDGIWDTSVSSSATAPVDPILSTVNTPASTPRSGGGGRSLAYISKKEQLPEKQLDNPAVFSKKKIASKSGISKIPKKKKTIALVPSSIEVVLPQKQKSPEHVIAAPVSVGRFNKIKLFIKTLFMR
jgi:hypothetical protein